MERECVAAKQTVAAELRDSLSALRANWDQLKAFADAETNAQAFIEPASGVKAEAEVQAEPRAEPDTRAEPELQRKSSVDSQASGECLQRLQLGNSRRDGAKGIGWRHLVC